MFDSFVPFIHFIHVLLLCMMYVNYMSIHVLLITVLYSAMSGWYIQVCTMTVKLDQSDYSKRG